MAKAKRKYTIGTAWFIAILIIAVIGATETLAPYTNYVWLILGISGAAIAILNIQVKEEISFLIGSTALIVLIIAFLLVPTISDLTVSIFELKTFLINLVVSIGIASFIISLAMIAKIGIEY
ncbi:MAG: hypothetical protein ACE5J4_01560 [Candidatus Aenigmatarchaeota archaeon]